MSLDEQLEQAEQKCAELTAQVDVRERVHTAVVKDLEQERRALQAQTERLQRKLESQLTELTALQIEHRNLVELTTLLKEEISWFKSQVYGRSSEKTATDSSPDQSMLFNEPEVLAAIATAIGHEEEAVITIDAHERKKKPGKKVIPEQFPRIELEPLDIPESERTCPHDGTPLEVIGAETSERYHLVPATLEVWVQKRLKRACPCCHQGVKIAPLPPQILPKCQASASLLAHITTAKYVDGLPLTRQSKQFERMGMSLGSGTMALWVNTIGKEKLPPLIQLINHALLAEPTVHCDETTVQVLKSEKAVSSDHYMIVRAAGPPGRRIVLFDYAPTRNVATIKELLTGPDGPYRGNLVCDGLELYDYLALDPAFAGLVLCGCLTHCRRYYDKSVKLTESPVGQQHARVAIRDFLGKVFLIERQIDERREARERAGGVWDPSETLTIRKDRSAPIMSAFKTWVDELGPSVPPKSTLGKALGYTQSQWVKLTRFLEHPVPAHNNRVENDIRPFAVGRRAWLFIDTPGGARASANLYSLASTCRVNGVNAYAYFTYLYEHLPLAKTAADLTALLPWNVKPLLRGPSKPIK